MAELAPPTPTQSEPPEPPALSTGQRIGILAALMTGLLLGALDNFIVVTALPTIATDLHDVSGQVFVVSGYLIAQTIAIPVFGKLSDRFGRRSFYLLGLVIFLAGSAAAGLSQSLNELILFRAVQGLGSGAFFTVVFSIVADLFPPKAAARLAGMLSAVFGIAIVFGPLIGSYIVDTTTWRWIFFVNLPVGIAAIALVLATIRPLAPTPSRLRFDTLGAGLLAVWVGALIFALVETSNGWSWTDPRTVSLLATAVLLFLAFLWQELRAEDPLVPLRLFKTRLVAAASGVNFLRGALLTGVVTFVPILVQFGLGGSADTSRDILYAFMVPMIVGAALGGALVSRFGYRIPAVLGLSFGVIGSLLLTAVPTVPPAIRLTAVVLPVGLAGALVPLGFGVGLTFAPTQLAIQYSVARKDVGTGNSLVWFLGNLGGSILVSVFGTIEQSRFNVLAGPKPDPTSPAFLSWLAGTPSATAVAIQEIWWLTLGVAIVGLAFALFVAGRLPKSHSAAESASAEAVAEPLPTMMG